MAMALDAHLPHFLLEGVINAPPWALEDVRSPSALKVHAVDALKAMLSAAKIGRWPPFILSDNIYSLTMTYM